MALDLKYVRSNFPTLSKNDYIYMDNAGGSLVLKKVADRISNHLLETPVQHGASYSKSLDAAKRLAKASKTISQLINADRPEEIVFGPSATGVIKILAESYGKSLEEGDEIILSDLEHEANRGAWEDLSEKGINIIPWNMGEDETKLTPESLAPLLTEKTNLVVVTHASNILGAINPIKKITNLAHKHGVRVVVDGVAYAPHRRVDVKALGCDHYIFSFYKMFGPHYACLYGKYDVLLDLPGVNHKGISEDRIPYKFQPGNPNYELAWGCIGIVEYLKKIGQQTLGAGSGIKASLDEAFEQISTHEQKLTKRLLDYLTSKEGVKIIGPKTSSKKERIAIVSFVKEGMTSLEIVSSLDDKNIGIRHGDFNSSNLVTQMGLGDSKGVVRVSMAHYNTIEEVDELTGYLDAIL